MCDQLLPLAPKGSVNLGRERCVKKASADVTNTCLTLGVARPEDEYGQDCIFTGFIYVSHWLNLEQMSMSLKWMVRSKETDSLLRLLGSQQPPYQTKSRVYLWS